MSGFFDLQPANLERSPAWRITLDRLMDLANADHPRAGGPLVHLSVEAIDELARAGWQPDRPRAWSEAKRNGSDPELGNAHAQTYLRMLRRASAQFLGSEGLEEWVHDCVQRSAYRLARPHVPGPSFGGPIASAVDVFFSGASGATSARESAWYPYRRQFLSGHPAKFNFDKESL